MTTGRWNAYARISAENRDKQKGPSQLDGPLELLGLAVKPPNLYSPERASFCGVQQPQAQQQQQQAWKEQSGVWGNCDMRLFMVFPAFSVRWLGPNGMRRRV